MRIVNDPSMKEEEQDPEEFEQLELGQGKCSHCLIILFIFIKFTFTFIACVLILQTLRT
jgi:hypothetical protein